MGAPAGQRRRLVPLALAWAASPAVEVAREKGGRELLRVPFG